MKKVVFVVCFLLACAGMNFAQTAPAKKDAAKKETATKTPKKIQEGDLSKPKREY